MIEEVMITILGSQSTLEGKSDEVKTCAEGQLMFEKDVHTLRFTENGELGTIENTITLTNQMLRVEKSGAVKTAMIFEENQKHYFDYETPFGLIPLAVLSGKMEIDKRMDYLRVDIPYQLLAGEDVLADCNICVEAETKK